MNYCNYIGFYTIIEKRPIKSHDDYYVENWKLSLFLLDTNVYYEDDGNPIVYNETFASLDESQNKIENTKNLKIVMLVGQ